MNVSNLIFPPEEATDRTADEWYIELVDMQVATLVFQQHDMVSAEEDCRNKYVARQIFRWATT